MLKATVFKNRKCEICTEVTHTIELECGHEMCKSCGSQWFKKSTSCPFCTLELSPASIKTDFDTEQTTTQIAEYTADFDMTGYASITPDEAVNRFWQLETFLTNLFNGPRMFSGDGLGGLIANERYIAPIIPTAIDPSNEPARQNPFYPGEALVSGWSLQIGGQEIGGMNQLPARTDRPENRESVPMTRYNEISIPTVAMQYGNTPIEIEINTSELFGLQPLPAIRPPPLQLEPIAPPVQNRRVARRSSRSHRVP